MPFIYGTLPTGPDIPPNTDAENAIVSYIHGAWAAFAKDPVNALATYQDGWPQCSPSGPTLIRIGYDNKTGTNVAFPSVYDATCLKTFAVDLADA
ncbi:uncharacterized protein Z518_03589 [Rhinocladiella mackenziei CBS 650.93]|uniref:Carboxylesterase type B domain-containing protein n=1 Tax=Rhinocladiella mackenziei CBS 650.93 TaxID=1442369 RepID=A0A0D2FU33_9EURO|nr:uncharacterized protein Z518_03589 [Rhinocladiella mackenziei CBS 650.93]KIX05617.1 hypothetical protein Z518_03589 [Rhinocladiella mackenziei CBS 650.93]